MSKAGPPSLWIHPAGRSDVLAQQQPRVDHLLREVALWRGALGEWQDRIARYHAAVEPVRRELHAAWRQWVFALDHASLQPGLSRAERAESLRDVYRRLASALHPDREPDAQQRECKTALMQQANLAYAEEDLSALIDLQRRTEHMDAARLGSMDRQRLAHYVTLLEEQLADLQSATRRLACAGKA